MSKVVVWDYVVLRRIHNDGDSRRRDRRMVSVMGNNKTMIEISIEYRREIEIDR